MKKKPDGYNLNRAKLPTKNVQGIRPSHRQENHFDAQYTVVNPAKRKELMVLRIYSTNGAHTACLWVWSDAYIINGSGKAGGWGYHRASAAAEAAISNAGIAMAKSFGGCGDGSIDTALKAIARAMGCRNPWIIKAHA